MSTLSALPLNISITGTGAICAAGDSPETLFQSVWDDRSAIRDGLGRVDANFAPGTPRALSFAAFAAQQAMQAAGWTELRPDDAIFLGSTTGQIDLWEGALMGHAREEIESETLRAALVYEPLSGLADALSGKLGFRGKRWIISTACAASTHALALATMGLRQGKFRRCLVGGAEVLSELTVQGFRSLQLLSSSQATPFDKNRSGINLSEGAAFLCLEVDSPEREIARLVGGGFASDAYHMTAPHPEGDGCRRAMEGALRSSALSPEDIGWVHAHGTGSPLNDLAEGLAVQKLFGPESAWVSSTKGIHGHSLGAAGALETVLCVEALRRGVVLKTSGLKTRDDAFSIRHPETHVADRIDYIMKTTAGFGGSNAAIVIGRGRA